MNTRITMARLLSVAAIVIGICLSAGQPVLANACDPVYVTQVGNTFTVAPTGGDDTANLQCAFDAAGAAGPGSTVQLANGTYSIGRIVVDEFHGNFVGAGKEQTTITTISPLDCSGGWPELMAFRKGISMADLTFDISNPHPCQPWQHTWMGARDDLAVIVAVSGQPVGWASPDFDWDNAPVVEASSSFENIAFRGAIDLEAPLFPWGVSVPILLNGGVEILPNGIGRFVPLTGVHTVANCSFENVYFGIVASALESSTVLIGGSGSKGNTFENVGMGLWASDNSNSSIEFSHNDVPRADYVGVLIQHSASPFYLDIPWYSPSRYVVSHNTFHTAGYADAVGLVDYATYFTGKTVEAVVSHNRITLDGTSFGGIFGVAAQDVLVANNKISGSGLAGIYFGQNGPATGWTLVGNNVQGVVADVAPIWLGEYTSACTVVGGGSQTNVLDEGTNNIIAGVNTRGGNPPGPAIREAMQRKLEILRLFR